MNEISNKYQLEIDTINLLINQGFDVTLCSDKRYNNLFVLFRDKKGFWNIIMFDRMSKEKGEIYADIGQVELGFVKNSCAFALILYGSFSVTSQVLKFLYDDKYGWDKRTGFHSVSGILISKANNYSVLKVMDENNFVRVLEYLSIYY